jgi:hypothetical protein
MAKQAALVAFLLSLIVALWGGITLASQQSGGGSAGLSGSYPADLNVQQDTCGHDPFIFGQSNHPPHNIKLNVDTGGPGTSITITGPAPWVTVNGTLDAAGGFEATGQGTVAGFQNTQVTFAGTLTGGVLTGKYTFGNTNPPGQGGLPPCGPVGAQVSHPAVYGVKPKPVTPTPTPHKLYSIIVLKLNDNNLQPLPGWLMRLYSGTGCQGTALSSHITTANGLYDFEGLEPGSYSVAEVNQTGWNPDGPTCRDVTLGSLASGVVATCPIQPDQPFPQPGCDSFQSAAKVNITFNGTDQVISAELSGPTLIERKNKPRDINGNGLDEIQTEIVSLELTGGGVTVHLAPSPASTGLIEEQLNSTPGLDFPANSFFDVFFEVVVNGHTLHNATPLRVQCKITEIPPYKCLYFPSISDPILLFDPQGVKVGELLHGLHIPIPPNEKIVIFSNRPKGTTTPTPAVTPTPTRTRTPTPTTTPSTSTPTPANPPPNGTCTKTAQGVPLQNKTWDQWKCIPNPPNTHFNRIDIFVGSATQDPVLSAAHFVCQTTNQKVVGVLKGHKKDVNPGTTLPNDEIWSGTFDPKCVEGVNVYVQPVSPAVHPVILQVAFTDTQSPTPTASATTTRPPTNTPPPQPPTLTPTPTPRPRNGDANKDGTTNPIDATLVLQFSAGLITSINPSSDVNGDGTSNPIDGTLILQFSAGLLNMLPV